jgi:DNA repair protein RadD
VSGIILRDYQKAWIAGLRAAISAGFLSILGVLPTGGGKTVCFSYLVSRIVGNGKRVIVMAHREEILDQISRTLAKFDVRHGMITSSALYDRRLLAHVASVATLWRRIERIAVPDYVIVDEAHHAITASLYGKIITYWRERNPNLRVIGVTATPERLSGEGLGETFQEMVLGPTPRELIDLGALSDYRLFAPSVGIDLSGVGMRGGDYKKDALGAVLDKPAIIGSAVGEYRKLCGGLPAVAFCVSIDHAHHTAEQFRASGYRAAAIDGKMDKTLRREIVRDFGRGAINVLTSAEIVSEGFDIPGIVAAILLRPTHSLALYLQQVGRALRPAEGKESAIILDHVLNSSRHGLPDDPRAWSLLGREERKKKSDEPNVACRQCERCYAVSPAAASKCRECGALFPVKARKIEEVAGTLSEVEIARMRRESVRVQAAAKTLEDLIAVGMARGMRNPVGWATHVNAARIAKQQGRAG